MGDFSDTLELGSALNKSIENNNYVSRANIQEQQSMLAIKRQDFGHDSIEGLNRDDISERSYAPPNNANLNLSASLTGNAGALNTAASAHLRDAMAEMKQQANDNKNDMSFRVLNTSKQPSNNINKTDSTSVYAAPRNEGAGSRENSVEAVSKVAVQKMPVSIFIYFTMSFQANIIFVMQMASNIDMKRMGMILEKLNNTILR